MGRIMRIIHGLLVLQWLVGRIIVYNPWIMPIICRLYESDHNLHEQQLWALHQVRSFIYNERPMRQALFAVFFHILFIWETSGKPMLCTECLRGHPFPPHQQTDW